MATLDRAALVVDTVIRLFLVDPWYRTLQRRYPALTPFVMTKVLLEVALICALLSTGLALASQGGSPLSSLLWVDLLAFMIRDHRAETTRRACGETRRPSTASVGSARLATRVMMSMLAVILLFGVLTGLLFSVLCEAWALSPGYLLLTLQVSALAVTFHLHGLDAARWDS